MTRARVIASLTIATMAYCPAAASPAAASPFSIRVAQPERGGLRPAEHGDPLGDDTPSDAARREAAAAFADGEAAFERADYTVAAARFDRAHRLSPHQWTLYNLALSRARAGDSIGAWGAFDELSRIAAGAEERREAARERDALLPLLAIVTVRGPTGARACLDGAPIVVDDDGAVERVVVPGVHRVAPAPGSGEIDLRPGGRAELDATPREPPRDRVRPWLVVAAVGSAGALAGGTTAAVLADGRATRALAGVAAGAGALALGATVVALVRRGRERRAAPVALPCFATATQKRPPSTTPPP